MSQVFDMKTDFRELIKAQAAQAARLAPAGRFSHGIFVLSHMRAATTALTNVLCSHDAISGYGETHVSYQTPSAPGRVIVNLALRRAFNPRAPYFVDKLLHNRLDENVTNAFFNARALFMVRAPAPAIKSIVKLSERTRLIEGATPTAAAIYYADRLDRLAILWDRFSEQRRFGLTAESLLADPDQAIAEIGSYLSLEPTLTNRYEQHSATQKGGGGDPTRSAKHSQIEKIEGPPQETPFDPTIPAPLVTRCEAAYQTMLDLFATQLG